MKQQNKECISCHITKPATNEFFHKQSTGKLGFRGICKICRSNREKKELKTTLICTKCKIEKPFTKEYFYTNTKNLRFVGKGTCKECKAKDQRNIHLKLNYGITDEDYIKMYKKQFGKCAICNLSYDLLYVDHNHTTGEVRKLLCSNCNFIIGHSKESIDILNNVISYLKEYEKSMSK